MMTGTNTFSVYRGSLFATAIAFGVIASVQLSLGSEPAKAPPKEASGSAPATQPATFDELLSKAIANHPGVAMAKAKMMLAEAELRKMQIDVARQVIDARDKLKMNKASFENAKEELEEVLKKRDELGNDPQSRQEYLRLIGERRHAVLEAQSNVEGCERELQSLVSGGVMPADFKLQAVGLSKQAPEGPMADKFKTALNESGDCDFAETPLKDIMDFCAERYRTQVVLQPEALHQAGIDPYQTLISLSIKGAPLWSTLQALEDQVSGIQFVVRDYGIMLTSKESAQRNGYMSAVQFGKEAQSEAKSRAAK